MATLNVKVTLFGIVTIATILLVTPNFKGFFYAVYSYQLELRVVAKFVWNDQL